MSETRFHIASTIRDRLKSKLTAHLVILRVIFFFVFSDTLTMIHVLVRRSFIINDVATILNLS